MENKKNLKSLRNDKRAVSPVIGVILMVAITVILAAVIGAFVFGYGTPAKTPVTQIQATTHSGPTHASEILLTHLGGDAVDKMDLRIQTSNDGGATWTDVAEYPFASAVFAAGDTQVVTDATGAAEGATVTIRILYMPSGGLLLKTTVTTGVA